MNWDWLLSEAGAAYVGIPLTALVTWAGTYAKRKRPNQVVAREVEHSSLVLVRDVVRDAIHVEFLGRKVTSLSWAIVEFSNPGSSAVRDAEVTVTLPEETEILGVRFDEQSEDMGFKATKEQRAVVCQLPFLNPVKEHKHRPSLHIIANGATSMRFVGGGPGWSLCHVRFPSRRDLRRQLLRSALAVVLSFGAYMAYSFLVVRQMGIDSNEVSWRALFALLPALAIAMVPVYYMFRTMRRLNRFVLTSGSGRATLAASATAPPYD